MEFMSTVEAIRRERRLTQARMAARVGLSERQYRAHVAGQYEMRPADQNRVAHELRSPLLATLVLAQFEDNPFAPVPLEVDDHPAQALFAAISEIQEARDAVGVLNPCKPDREAIVHAIDQLFDILHLLPVVCASWATAYRIDLWALRARNVAKLRERGYLAQERDAA